MTDHAEVMRIAEGLDAVPETGADPALIQEAADALRRQSAETERLRAELEAVRGQEPVAWMNVRNGFICKKPTNADYQQPLYLAAGAQPAPSVPEGWKLVPVEPTDEMLMYVIGFTLMDRDTLRDNYAAMLAAAPEAPSVPEGWKLVPIEPTAEMLIDMREKHWKTNGCQLCKADYQELYAAMLAAAPKAPKRKPLTYSDAVKVIEKTRMVWAKHRPPMFDFEVALVSAVEAAHGIGDEA